LSITDTYTELARSTMLLQAFHGRSAWKSGRKASIRRCGRSWTVKAMSKTRGESSGWMASSAL